MYSLLHALHSYCCARLSCACVYLVIIIASTATVYNSGLVMIRFRGGSRTLERGVLVNKCAFVREKLRPRPLLLNKSHPLNGIAAE